MDKRSFIQNIKTYLKDKPKASISAAVSALGLGMIFNKYRNDKTVQKYLGDIKQKKKDKQKLDTRGDIGEKIQDFMGGL